MKKIIIAILVTLMVVFVVAPPLSGGETNANQEVKKVVQEFLDSVFNKRDFKKLETLVHKDAVFINYVYTGIKTHSLGDWLQRLTQTPAESGRADFKFLSLHATGFAAGAVVEVWVAGKHLSTQHLLLYKLQRGWTIVGKTVYLPDYKLPLKRKEIKLPAKVLDSYLGYYKSDQGVVVSVTKLENSLFITLPGQKPQEIFPETENRFFVKIADSTITFDKIGEEGAGKLQLKHGDRVIEAVRINPKVGVFAGKRRALAINLVIAGPFIQKSEALAIYQGNLPDDIKIMETDAGKIGPGFYVVENEPWVTETDLEEVNRTQSPSGKLGLDLTFTTGAADKLQQLTLANQGKHVAYIVGDKVVLVPKIAAPMSRRARLVGNFTPDEISQLIVDLKLAISKNKLK